MISYIINLLYFVVFYCFVDDDNNTKNNKFVKVIKFMIRERTTLTVNKFFSVPIKVNAF